MFRLSVLCTANRNSVKYALIHVLRVTRNEKGVVVLRVWKYHLQRIFIHILLTPLSPQSVRSCCRARVLYIWESAGSYLIVVAVFAFAIILFLTKSCANEVSSVRLGIL